MWTCLDSCICMSCVRLVGLSSSVNSFDVWVGELRVIMWSCVLMNECTSLRNEGFYVKMKINSPIVQ